MTRGSQTDESVYQQQQCERSKKLALSAPERHVKMHLRSSQQPTFDQLHHFLDERRADLSLFLADERAACQPLPARAGAPGRRSEAADPSDPERSATEKSAGQTTSPFLGSSRLPGETGEVCKVMISPQVDRSYFGESGSRM